MKTFELKDTYSNWDDDKSTTFNNIIVALEELHKNVKSELMFLDIMGLAYECNISVGDGKAIATINRTNDGSSRTLTIEEVKLD